MPIAYLHDLIIVCTITSHNNSYGWHVSISGITDQHFEDAGHGMQYNRMVERQFHEMRVKFAETMLKKFLPYMKTRPKPDKPHSAAAPSPSRVARQPLCRRKVVDAAMHQVAQLMHGQMPQPWA